ncbi:MAG: META domain-containing protein [Shimia sp.]
MRAALPLLLAAFGCGDEGLTGYVAHDAWTLVEVDGEARGGLTLDLGTRGRIAGRAPCNTFGAAQEAPYPWFAPGPLAVTRRACPEAAAEADLLARLSRMSLAEAVGPVLILSNDAGGQMVFEAVPD